MESSLAVLPGDGVGPEVTSEALNALEAVRERFGRSFNFDEGLVGGVAIHTPGRARSDETLYDCRICQGRIGEANTVAYGKAELERLIVSSKSSSGWRGE
jgi:isocitrate/isopropylmalate dehydrogenase